MLILNITHPGFTPVASLFDFTNNKQIRVSHETRLTLKNVRTSKQCLGNMECKAFSVQNFASLKEIKTFVPIIIQPASCGRFNIFWRKQEKIKIEKTSLRVSTDLTDLARSASTRYPFNSFIGIWMTYQTIESFLLRVYWICHQFIYTPLFWKLKEFQ